MLFKIEIVHTSTSKVYKKQKYKNLRLPIRRQIQYINVQLVP